MTLFKTSDLVKGNSGSSASMGVVPNSVPLSQAGDNAVYVPYKRGSSGIFASNDETLMMPVFFGDTATVKSYFVDLDFWEERALIACLYQLGDNSFLKRGDLVHANSKVSIPANTLNLGLNELMLTNPVELERGWYMFAVSGDGQSSPGLTQSGGLSNTGHNPSDLFPQLSQNAEGTTQRLSYSISGNNNTSVKGADLQSVTNAPYFAFGIGAGA